MRKAVFFDKDGTLIVDVPYNVDPDKIVLQPGAAESVRRLRASGYLVIVISNQSGIAKGFFEEDAMKDVIATLRKLLQQEGGDIDGFFYCPHHPLGSVTPYARTCSCRKPAPGLLHMAAREFDIDLTRSWMIGDILHDVEAGHRAGCFTILLDNANETEWEFSPMRTPDVTVNQLSEAADYILQNEFQHDFR